MTTTPPNNNPLPSQQQSLGDVQVQGDDNIFNVVQGKVITLNQNKIIQISVDEIKTREFVGTSPYKGLKRFESEDKERFFGRDQFITGLVNELENTNFVLLLGASGSGKSSVVRAGLIPWLSEKWGTRWVNLPFTPDRDPFDSLYGSLLSRFKQSEAQIAREGTEATLSQLVKTLKEPESFWFIFIDQFEELFTTSEPEKRDRFIKSLAKLCQEYKGDSTVKIVATMRADFLDRLDVAPANRLARLTEGHRPLITQMQPDELRLAIEQPAAHHGVVFEEGLVEEIIKDVQGQPGYLPLMQYTLNMLWETEVSDGGINDRTLNIQSYRRIGGVRGALQQRVEEIYQNLSKEEQLAAQRIFLKLVGIGGDSATDWKPVRKREARSRFSDGVEQTVLSQLIDANLLVSDAPVEGDESESMVEIAHEILLSSWHQLRVWIDGNREAIAFRNRLNNDVSQWKTTNHDDELWEGIKLTKAAELQTDQTFNQVLGGFDSEATAFIQASLAQRERRKKQQEVRRRRILLGLSGFSTVSLALAGFALFQWRSVQRQKVNLFATTSNMIVATQPVEATVNAIAAIGLSKSNFVSFPDHDKFISARASLLDAIQSNSERNRFLHDAGANSVAFSLDGKTIVSGSDDKSVRFWDAQTGKLIGEPLVGHEDRVTSVAFSPDGKTVVSGSDDKSVRFWDAQTGKLIWESNHEEPVTSVVFSPNGNSIASSSQSNVSLWNAHTGLLIWEPVTEIGYLSGEVTSVAFNSTGNAIFIGFKDNFIQIWDAHTREVIGGKWDGDHDDSTFITSVAFSPDGKTIVSGSYNNNRVHLWNDHIETEIDESDKNKFYYGILNQDGEELFASGKQLTGHGDEVTAVAFSPDGKTIVSGSDDKSLRLWDAQTGELIGKPLIGHELRVTSVAFSPDGNTVASSSEDNSVRLWDIHHVKNSTWEQLTFQKNRINSVAFSPDSNTIAGGSGGIMYLWDARTGQVIWEHLASQEYDISAVAFSPNATTVAGSSGKNIQLWDARTGQILWEKPTDQEALVTSVAFSPDGKIMVSSSGGIMHLWDARTGQSIGTPLIGHEYEVDSMSFSLDGNTILSSSQDSVRLWDAYTGNLIRTPWIGQDNYSTAFRPDGKTVAILSGDTLNLWDTRTEEPTRTPLTSHTWGGAVGFSPNGKIIARVNWGFIDLWDAYTGNDIRKIPTQWKPGASLTFSPDSKSIATRDRGSIHLWNIQSGEFTGTLRSIHNDDSISYNPDFMIFSPDGKTVVSNIGNLWHTSPDSWLQKGCLQLQNHSILTLTDLGKEAKQVCEQRVYRLTRRENPLPLTSKLSTSNTPFQDAVYRATAAAALAQIAKNTEEWNDVAYHWQKAINLMKTVPPSDPNHTLAQAKVKEYRKNLTYAQAQAKAKSID